MTDLLMEDVGDLRRIREAVARLETVATKQQRVDLRDAAYRILNGYSPCMNCGTWSRADEGHSPCNPITQPAPDAKSVAEVMLERWRERRKRCLTGVAPTVAEIEAAMPSWSTEVVVQKDAPEGSAMRRAIDAAQHIIGMLWRHVESLRERFDYEIEQRDELHAAYSTAIDERDDALARHRRLDAAGKVNAELLAAAKDLAVKAKAFVDKSWELERMRCDDAVAAFNAAVQRAEEAGRG